MMNFIRYLLPCKLWRYTINMCSPITFIVHVYSKELVGLCSVDIMIIHSEIQMMTLFPPEKISYNGSFVYSRLICPLLATWRYQQASSWKHIQWQIDNSRN